MVLDTVSTIPPEPGSASALPEPDAAQTGELRRLWILQPGSLSRRLLAIAAVWIIPLLLVGGLMLDEALSKNLTRGFDNQLTQYLRSMIASAEIDGSGEVRFTRPLGDQRFFEPYSGLYWQVESKGQPPFRSRSLWDRALPLDLDHISFEERYQTIPAFQSEGLRVAERDAVLPGSNRVFHFAVAIQADELHAQIRDYRRILIWGLSVLGAILLILATLLATYGLWPLRQVRKALMTVRSGEETRVEQRFPPEIQPLVIELNALLAHSEEQAEQARTHAGNLAHALKTPMSVLLNEARGDKSLLGEAVLVQVGLMKRHVDHHLARARALGRRANIGARAPVWPSLESLKRALERIYQDKNITISLRGDAELAYRGERQDLEEMLGNLLDNACKYGSGKVRVTVTTAPPRNHEPYLCLIVEDNGPGIPEDLQHKLFERGVRLDQNSPGTGIGLAIVRDIAEIVGGSAQLGRSEALGGLQVTVILPAAETA